MDAFLQLITEPFREMYERLRAFMPNLLAAATVLIVGTGLGMLLRAVLRSMLGALHADAWCDRMGITGLLRKGNVWRKPSEVIARLTYWAFWTAVLMLALSMLKVEAVDQLIANAIHYLPRAVSGVLILFLGYLITGLLCRAILIAAVNSGSRYARLLAEAVRLLLTVLFLAMALEQLQVAPSIVTAAFSIIFGGIVLALAVSFGVGGIQAAKKLIEQEAERKTAEPADTEHL